MAPPTAHLGRCANYPVVGGQIVLATCRFMLQGPGELAFHITEASVPSLPGDLPVVTGATASCVVAALPPVTSPARWWLNLATRPVGGEVDCVRRRQEPVPLGRVL
ncbi:MAG: hypothetical protein IPH48_03380 [bacterium]|nr:hypothetical protein [bacterium]